MAAGPHSLFEGPISVGRSQRNGPHEHDGFLHDQSGELPQKDQDTSVLLLATQAEQATQIVTAFLVSDARHDAIVSAYEAAIMAYFEDASEV